MQGGRLFQLLATALLALAAYPVWSQPIGAPATPRAFAFAPGYSSGSYLGVGVAEISDERAHALKLTEDRGVEITRVDEGSPAEKAGLKTGDAVLEYNGQRIEGIEEFARLVRETPPGRRAKLVIGRGGTTLTLVATIGERKTRELRIEAMPGFAPLMTPPNLDMPDVMGALTGAPFGIEIESLSAQLAEYFGVKSGVLVRTVRKDSPAARAGLKAGDVILKVNGTWVEHPGDVTAAVQAAQNGRAFPVNVKRDHRDLALAVTLGGDSGGNNPPEATPVHAPE